MKTSISLFFSLVLMSGCISMKLPNTAESSPANPTVVNGTIVSLDPSWTPEWDLLTSYWQFDLDGSDARGLNPLTATGITFATPGEVGSGSAVFTGSNSYFTNPLALNNSEGTIAHWLNPSMAQNMVAVYESGGNNGSYDGFGTGSTGLTEIHTGATATQYIFDYEASPSGAFTIQKIYGGTAVVGQWAYVVATWNRAGSMKLYVNGVNVANQSMTSTTFSNVIPAYHYIGRTGMPGAATNWNGQMDEVAIWSKELTSDEIQTIFQRQLPSH